MDRRNVCPSTLDAHASQDFQPPIRPGRIKRQFTMLGVAPLLFNPPLPQTTELPQLLAIADITPDRVIAWDKNRKRLPEVERRLQAILDSRDFFALSFQFKKKNRWIIFSQTSGAGWPQFSSPQSRNVQINSFEQNGSNTLIGAQVAIAPDLKTIDLTGTLTLPTTDFIRIKMQPAPVAEIGGKTYVFGDFTKREDDGMFGGGFRVGPGAASGSPTKPFRWTANALGPNPGTFQGYGGVLYDRDLTSINTQFPCTLSYQEPLGALQLSIGVDPTTLGMIAFPVTKTMNLSFKGLPLDR
jgi:hypothetical protein